MHGTTSGLRTDTAARLAGLERERPEWQAWLRLLGEAERALDDVSWRTPFVEGGLGDPADPSADAPLLHGRTLEVDADRLQRLVHRLVSAAVAPGGNVTGVESLKRYQPSAADGVALLAAAVRQDGEELGALAAAAGVSTGAMTSLAHLAALPLLQSCGRLLEDLVPRFWPHGYCPICGAWPTLAERRGLDRTRRLRCGRCAAGWEVQWLCCIYCGEREHEQLGSLVPDDRGEMLKVETCASCRGYLKSVATLQEIPSFELLLQDLETVELDLVALDLGYGRPEERGFPLDVRVVVAPVP
jgi:FdhE protein